MHVQPPLNDLLVSLYADNPDAIAVYNRDGELLACNQAAILLSGYGTLEVVAGTHYRKHVYPEHLQRVDEAFRAALSGYTDHFEVPIRGQSGALVPVELYFFPARVNDRIAGVFAQARDTLAHREAERSVEDSQQRFRSLFEYHPDAIMKLKPDGLISRVNVALEIVTGFYGEQVINKPWTDIIAPESREEAAAAFHLASRGETSEFNSYLLDRLGNRIDVQVYVVPVHVGEAIQGAYAIAKNVVAQRSAERAIAAQSERIRELYLAAAARGESIQAQLDNTLALGCRLFGFDFGYVLRFDESTITILNAVGQGSGLSTGAVFPRENALSLLLLGDRQTVYIPDLDEPQWKNDPARVKAPWRSYFATKLLVNSSEFGALVFGARGPHGDIPELDRDLVQLMALFVAAALEREQHAQRMQQLAFFDALTGLPNRVLFDDRIKQTMSAAKRYHRGFAVMYLDLDGFKEINDRYGHPTGDRVLKEVAERLIHTLRESDTVARFGGDEFVILQPVINGASDAAELARKIISSMQAPLVVDGVGHVVHTSIGIALYPQDASSAEDLMDRADRALYRAKHGGRNRWQFFSEDEPLEDRAAPLPS